jgi:hypothetical protein
VKVLQGETPTKGTGFAGQRLAKLPAIPTFRWTSLITPTHAVKHKKRILQAFLDLFIMFSLKN